MKTCASLCLLGLIVAPRCLLAGPILSPSDPIIAVHYAGVGTSSSSYPGGESPPLAIDNNVGTKYLNFGGTGSGFIVTPSSSSVVQSFVITTANDAEDRDPSSYQFFGTNDAILSGDNSAGNAESWTLISSGAISLPTTRFTVGSPISFANTTAYSSYRMVFPTLRGTPQEMQIGEIQFYTEASAGGSTILAPGNLIRAIDFPIPGSNSSYPGNENPPNALDGNVDSKYLNFGEEGSGLIVTPKLGPTIVGGLQLWTANDAEERDPTSFEIWGTNSAISSGDNSAGLSETWTMIASGAVSLPMDRKTAGSLVNFANGTAYTSYKVVFPTVRNAGSANSMQISEIQLYEAEVIAPTVTWTGATSNEWSQSAGATNWSGDRTTFADGDIVRFDDAAVATTANISVADVLPAALTVDNPSQDYTFQGTHAIAGATRLIKKGAGTLTVLNNNTYTGGTKVEAGTLQVGNGGTTGEIAGDVVNDGLLVFKRSDEVTFSGKISGSGAVTKQGAGTLTLTGANSYSGSTTVNAGTLSVNSEANLGAGGLVLDGGIIQITGASAFNLGKGLTIGSGGGTVEVDNSAGARISGNITGTATFTKSGSGTLTMGAYAGPMKLTGGTLRLTSSQPGLITAAYKGTGGGSVDSAVDWTRAPDDLFTQAQINQPSTDGEYFLGKTGYVDNFAVQWTAYISIPTAGTYTFFTNSDDGSKLYLSEDGGVNWSTIASSDGEHPMSENQGDYSFPSPGYYAFRERFFENGGGAGCIVSWTPPGGSKQAIPAESFFTGAGAGGVTLAAVNMSGGAVLDTNGNDVTLGSLAGEAGTEVSLDTKQITVGTDGTSTIFGGLISGTAGSLIKEGIGTLTLQGANTYGGGTTVRAGTLKLANAEALLSGSSLTVEEGGTVVLSSGLSAAGVSHANSAQPVPEPGVWALLGAAALCGLAGWRRAKNRGL